MFSRLWRNFIGYVIIKIEGLSLEKLMNAAAAGGIRIIDCKRRAYTQIEAQVSFIGFLKLKKLLADAPCVLTGIKKCGLPFFFLSLWERKGLIFGAVVSAMLIYALTSFIWVIEIDTKGEVDVAGIQRKLAEIGIRPGILRKDVFPDAIENSLMISDRSLGWVGVNIRGVKLHLEAVAMEKPPQMIDSSTPVNIIASKDALIEKVIVYEGWQAALEGQTVRKGDLLVSGVNPAGSATARRVHARSEVIGSVWYVGRAGASILEEERMRTAAIGESTFLCMGGWKVPLAGSRPDLPDYDTEAYKQLATQIYFPVYIMKETYYAVEKVEKARDLEPLRNELGKEAVRCAAAQLPEGAAVLGVSVVFVQTGENRVEAQAFIQARERIDCEELIINE